MLRIDETSGTLVAPAAAGLEREAAPEREALLSLVTGSWDAFAGELGIGDVTLVAREPVPYVDLLGLDRVQRRPVVVLVTGDSVEWQLGRALGAAAEVASWDAAQLAAIDQALTGVAPGQSPALVLVAAGYDPRALATIAWLSTSHQLPIAAYTLAIVRFGGERLLSLRREPAEVDRDAAAEIQALLQETIGR